MKIVIVGGGISGLSLAYFLLQRERGLEIEVLEAEQRAGGKVWTDRTEGFLCERGVNGFLDNRPRTLELASALGLEPLRSNDNARRRFIFSEEKLHLLPESPAAFFRSNLLSLKGRLRILWEVFAPRGMADDESLAEFAIRRLGREAYEKLIDPMASGIYAGDSTRLSLRSCFPRIHELEQTYGSLIRAMMSLQREARKTGRKVGAGPGGVLTSFHGGMEALIEYLRKALGERIRLGRPVVSLDRRGDTYVIYPEGGGEVEADILVFATPAHATASIFADFHRQISGNLREIPYPAVAVVCLGFRKDRIRHPLDGFGFLVPRREDRKILGTLWDSSIFPDRAPEGHVLLRTMAGGACASHIAMQDDERIVADVLGELKAVMGIKTDPEMVRVYRHEKAIPQYNVGHTRLLEEIDSFVGRCRGLYLTGNSYRGIGLNDCIENSFRLSEQILGK